MSLVDAVVGALFCRWVGWIVRGRDEHEPLGLDVLLVRRPEPDSRRPRLTAPCSNAYGAIAASDTAKTCEQQYISQKYLLLGVRPPAHSRRRPARSCDPPPGRVLPPWARDNPLPVLHRVSSLAPLRRPRVPRVAHSGRSGHAQGDDAPTRFARAEDQHD